MKKISLDFDGVVYDLDTLHQVFIKETYGENYSTTDATYWEYLYERYPSIVKVWTDWAIYKTAPFIDGAIDFVDELKKRYGSESIQFVTSSPESIQKEKTKMIEKIFGLDVIHVTKEKKSIYTNGTILMDDAKHNIIDHLENTPNQAILFDLNGAYGWSKDFKVCERSVRAKSYADVLKIFEERI